MESFLRKITFFKKAFLPGPRWNNMTKRKCIYNPHSPPAICCCETTFPHMQKALSSFSDYSKNMLTSNVQSYIKEESKKYINPSTLRKSNCVTLFNTYTPRSMPISSQGFPQPQGSSWCRWDVRRNLWKGFFFLSLTLKNGSLSLGWCGSVEWAPTWESKAH